MNGLPFKLNRIQRSAGLLHHVRSDRIDQAGGEASVASLTRCLRPRTETGQLA
jgi:hypothetical protein